MLGETLPLLGTGVWPRQADAQAGAARHWAGAFPRLPSATIYGFSLVLALAYAAFFSWLSLQRYDAFLMHALDMGNMDQAFWNTLHGHPFSFTNMRAPLDAEAFGTSTRLSFHVEPILLPLSLLYLIHAGPQTLIIAQALIVALGAPAAARLALRQTSSGALAIAAAAAYLLAPSLQAATLYEFHPVTLAAPLLLWAITFAAEGRYLPYAFCAAGAMACKEEIGLLVATLGLWILWRRGNTRAGLFSLILGAGWSLLALQVIIPHFASGPSAYWQRYVDASKTSADTGAASVFRYWLHHPEKLWHTLILPAKGGMLHRQLVSVGYLSLLSLATLLISLPSLAILLLSTDQHMYGGLGHYSAELVPIQVAAAIFGVSRLAGLARRRGLALAPLVPPLCAAWLVGLALLNARANGFTPLANGYAAPTISAHDRLGAKLLALIPAGASVSAQDQLNPHLGERAGIYLYPDTDDAEYVALDVTSNVNPLLPADQQHAASVLLASRHWRILAAQDGYLILRRTATPLPVAPTLPAAFYTFTAASPAQADQPPIARFGDLLELLSVRVQRREQVNLRVPDVILLTDWRVLRPLPAGFGMSVLVTNTGGHVKNDFEDQPTLDWLPPGRWHVGQLVTVQSRQISIVAEAPGAVGFRLKLYQKLISGQFRVFAPLLMGHERAPNVGIVGDTLQVARLPVVF